MPSKFQFSKGDVIQIYSITSGSPNGARLDRAGSYIIRNGEFLTLALSNEQTIGMKEDILRNGSKVNKPILLTTSAQPYSAFPTVHYAKESNAFAGLFAFIQTEKPKNDQDFAHKLRNNVLTLLAAKPKSFEVVTDQGTYHLSYGSRFSLGREDQLLFSLLRTQFPWDLLHALLILIVLKILFQPPFVKWFDNFAAQLLVIVIDFFLVTRFLFAFRASNLYPFSDEAIGLSLLAFLLVPYLMFAAASLARSAWTRKEAGNFIVYSAVCVVAAQWIIPPYVWLISSVVFLAAVVAFFRYRTHWTLSALRPSLAGIKSWSAEAWLGLFMVIALVLQWWGAGEAVQVGAIRIPLGLLYHPLFLLFSCHYLYRLQQLLQAEKRSDSFRRAWVLVLKFGLVLICFFLLSFAMSDFGFFLVYCLPALFLLSGVAVLYLREYELKWKATGAALLCGLFILLLLFSSFNTITRVLPLSYLSHPVAQRILLAVDPRTLEDSGLLSAERQLGHQRTFLAYAQSGLNGGGYMGRPISSGMSSTALNDNVPSAFLLNDFGVFGMMGVLLVIALMGYLWVRATAGIPAQFGRLFSLACLISLFYADLYMLLANCGILLFTGKNVFFWGLNSISDIFHASVLVISMMLPLIGVRETSADLPQPVSYVGLATV